MTRASTHRRAGARPRDQIAGELAQAIQLRRDLAELEIRHDRALLKRFSLVGGIAAALVLCGVPLLLTAAAWELAQVTELGFAGWLILFACGARRARHRGAWCWESASCEASFADCRTRWRNSGKIWLWVREWAKPGPGRLGTSADIHR